MAPASAISPLSSILYKSWAKLPLDAAEQRTLNAWLLEEDNQLVFREITAGNWPAQDVALYNAPSLEANWELVQQKIAAQTPVRRMWPRWVAAAGIALFMGAGLWYYSGHRSATHAIQLADIQPGKQGAILTLANGQQVVLDSLKNGLVSNQKGGNVVLSNGHLVYHPSNLNDGTDYNTMSTPNGRQFMMVLPDGSKVWLNAQSSIHYPVAFTGKERRVEVSGEAYFEIEKNNNQPFIISVAGGKADIAVLGTRFNVNAYEDESAINTTLLDGAVNVSNRSETKLLKPGYTARLTDHFQVTAANVDKVMAWKNGAFDFDGASLPAVMRQLSRWYDIEVVIAPGLDNIVFGGKMSRDVPLQGLLRGLESTGVHFRLEDHRKLVVYK